MKERLKIILFIIFSGSIADILRKLSKQLHAKIANKRFACNALHGLSCYNICINSDLSVSCNCEDYNGDGHIGDLNFQTLEEVFKGKTAAFFHDKLSRGILPIPHCSKCTELRLVSKNDTNYCLDNIHVPQSGIMVENTVACNLKCLGCNRDIILNSRNKHQMTLADIDKVASVLSSHNIKQICFFNLGEPFLSPTVCAEIGILRKHNPNAIILTSTNGIFLDSDEKRESVLLLDHVYLSIDGSSNDLVNKYQVGGDFEKSFSNMKQLVEYRNNKGALLPVIEWKYVLFKWNDKPKDILSAINLAREAGVDIISFVPGRAPRSYMSLRYWFYPFYQTLGTKSYLGRSIDFRKDKYNSFRRCNTTQ